MIEYSSRTTALARERPQHENVNKLMEMHRYIKDDITVILTVLELLSIHCFENILMN
jgi:hypothetical protein